MTRRQIRWAVKAVLILLCIVAVASLLIQVPGPASKRAMRTSNVTRVRGLYPAIKMYAGEHDGRYPPDLLEIYPRYISTADAVRYRDYRSGRKYDWFYVSGLTELSPAHWILVASPTEEINDNPDRLGRIVLRNDGKAEVIHADAFDREISKQREALRALSSAVSQ